MLPNLSGNGVSKAELLPILDDSVDEAQLPLSIIIRMKNERDMQKWYSKKEAFLKKHVANGVEENMSNKKEDQKKHDMIEKIIRDYLKEHVPNSVTVVPTGAWVVKDKEDEKPKSEHDILIVHGIHLSITLQIIIKMKALGVILHPNMPWYSLLE